MSDLKSRLQSLPPEKRAFLLEQIKKKQQTLANRIPPLPRDGQTFPLTFAQERMWFLFQLEPTSPLYNISIVFHITGRLDPYLLQQSFTILINHHEALRTTFETVADHPQQVIHPTAPLAFSSIDLTFEKNAEERFYQLANAELRNPFDLQKFPLMRVVLFKISHKNYRLMITMHHIISDGWSLAVLAQDLAAIYTNLKNKEPVSHQPPAIQSADFAVWQRQWLQDNNLTSLLNYWQNHLENVSQTLELPHDPPEQLTTNVLTGHRLPFQLDDALYQGAKQMAQEQEATLFMVLLSAFAMLLSRLSGQTDFVIGAPIFNRNRAETMPVIGVFVNTLALRMDLSGDPSFLTVLGRVRQTVLAGMQHQELPFAKLVDNLKLERFLNQSPLFQISFSLQENPLQAIEMPSVTITLLEIQTLQASGKLPPLHTGVSMFDITMHLSEITNEVGGWLEYRHNLFTPSAIQRFADQYTTLLAHIITTPHQPLSQLSLITPADSQKLLYQWNDTQVTLPATLCLHQLFEQQLQTFAHHIAIEDIQSNGQKQTYTYAELNHRANQLAHHLQQIGIGAETIIGICADRSIEMIVAILAVMKAGAAYVPLAPDYPQHRLKYMIADAHITTLLTQSHLQDTIPDYQGVKLCLDADWPDIAQQPISDVHTHLQPANLAYMIYTSGSTGQPKGTMITHYSICNLILTQIESFRLNPTSRVLQFASFSFDAAISEIFTTLLAGATLVLASADKLLPSEAFVNLMNDEKISVITLPPSVLQALSNYHFPHLKTLVSAGELCSWKIVDTFKKTNHFLNFYGPTEATVGCSYYEVTQHLKNIPSVPIGRAINNIQLYVVDQHLNLAPIGVPGELMIGGISLARGYWHRPSLTAEKFIPDPFSKTAGARLYRTADLVRYWPDGYIEFLGRIDHQVKLRGYRIELGEIENVLKEHPAIRETTVILRNDVATTPQLVAYFIPQAEEMAELNMLRHFLHARLPDYMVPATFVPMENWPLTSNNKVDRKALPKPQNRHLKPKRRYVASRNTLEETLTQIWQTLLQQEQISVYDNFFELGGDSIMGIQIVARARQQGIYLTPRQIFQHQTIAELAAVANTMPEVEAQQGLVTGAVPLTPIQNWFFNHDFTPIHHWNQAVCLSITAHLNLAWLQQTLVTLQTHHDALRLRFQHDTNNGWQQYNTLPQENSIITIAILGHLTAQEQQHEQQRAIVKAQTTLNIITGPLLRAIYFDFGVDKPGQLCFVAHHLIIDAVSWRIILEDFQVIYQQLCQGHTLTLPSKTTSYQQWSRHLQQFATTQNPAERLAYWLSLPPTTTPLPLDKTDAQQLTEASKATQTHTLSSLPTQQLLQDVQTVYNTQINDFLLTALTLTLQEWCATPGVWVDLESHGREDMFDTIDLSRTVGWFTTVYPVFLNTLPSNNYGENLKHIKEQLRQIPNNGFDYTLLQYWADHPDTQPLHTLPRPQISFNYLGQLDTSAQPDQMLTLDIKADLSPLRAPEAAALHLFEIEIQIVANQLEIHWHYNQKAHTAATCNQLLHTYIKHLQGLIDHCLNPAVGGYTPSDFPDADLTTDLLDNIFAELEL